MKKNKKTRVNARPESPRFAPHTAEAELGDHGIFGQTIVEASHQEH